jgi:hypothetical protein
MISILNNWLLKCYGVFSLQAHARVRSPKHNNAVSFNYLSTELIAKAVGFK